MAIQKAITISNDAVKFAPVFPQLGEYEVHEPPASVRSEAAWEKWKSGCTKTEFLKFAADLEKAAAYFRAAANNPGLVRHRDIVDALSVDLPYRVEDFAEFANCVLN